jgi:hypothetical protein
MEVLTMAEYIERSAGVSILRAKANMAVLMDSAPYFEKAAQMLEKLPAADVAPVVRCKDCKHRVYKYMNEEIGEIGGCGLFNRAMSNDDFCSYGERKESDDQ